MTSIRNVKGTRDLLEEEAGLWNAVEQWVRSCFGLYGFGEIRTPILEDQALFVRGVGESSDIVGKEMYSFKDRKGRDLCLRPESTAAVARAYVQHRLQDAPQPVKLYYMGPQFRYERPQKGRYRQFQQIGAELIGDEGPASDAELLVMLMRFLGGLHFEDLTIRLNTVGNADSRSAFGDALRDYLEPHKDHLGEDSQRRLSTNPLRILDTKNPGERELLEDAPELSQFLSDECREHFAGLRRLLDHFDLPYQVDPKLVRGLDYYTRTVFEISSDSLGAQDAILGGGRYDGLISQLGGNATPGIGFAIGQDRLVDVLPQSFRALHQRPRPVVVVPIGLERGTELVLDVTERLRSVGITAIAELQSKSMKAALRLANRKNAIGAVLLGESEIAAGTVTYKDFSTSEQSTIDKNDLASELVRMLGI